MMQSAVKFGTGPQSVGEHAFRTEEMREGDSAEASAAPPKEFPTADLVRRRQGTLS